MIREINLKSIYSFFPIIAQVQSLIFFNKLLKYFLDEAKNLHFTIIYILCLARSFSESQKSLKQNQYWSTFLKNASGNTFYALVRPFREFE